MATNSGFQFPSQDSLFNPQLALPFLAHLLGGGNQSTDSSAQNPGAGGQMFSPQLAAQALPLLAQLFGGGNQSAPGTNATSSGAGLMSQLAELFDQGVVEYARQVSMKDQGKEAPQSSKAGETLASSLPQTRESRKDGKYTLEIPLGAEVKPQDLKITIKDHDLIIDVKSEIKAEDGSSRLYQELTKRVTLPEDVKIQEVKSVLAPNGVLKIEAPLPQAPSPAKPESVEIPVTMELD